MRNEYSNPLPNMLPGTVHAQWVTCGRMECRCVEGDRHGPYYYRFWIEDGKQRKRYVPRLDIAEVRARCKARQEFEAAIKDSRARLLKLATIIKEATHDYVDGLESTERHGS